MVNWTQTERWQVLGVGALVVACVCAGMLLVPRGLLSPQALSVVGPAMVIGPLPAILIPPMAFIMYNAWMCRLTLDRVHPVSLALTTFLFIFSVVVSGIYYVQAWSARGFTTPVWMYNTWAAMSLCLIAGAGWLLATAALRGSALRFMAAHLMMTVWFFSFAFPWMGESV